MAATRSGAWTWLGLLCAALAGLAGCTQLRASAAHTRQRQPAPDATRVLDDFEDAALWQAHGSDGVRASAESIPALAGRGVRLRFDFQGHGGYAALRRAMALPLPANYEIAFDLRGAAPVNDLQLKFMDASGENVWWFRSNDFVFSGGWQHITVKKRQVEFAWGPTQVRELDQAAGLEFVVAAGRDGGGGFLELDRLSIRELPAPPKRWPQPVASASSSAADGGAALAVDGRTESAWCSVPERGKAQLLELDLGMLREFGGIVLRWRPNGAASRYDVEVSRDRASWQQVRQVSEANGGVEARASAREQHVEAGASAREQKVDALRLPETEARFVRLRLHDGPGGRYELAELEIRELAFGASSNAFFGALARESPRGHYPRGFSGEQPYWTLVGADGASQSGLLSEDAALEVGAGGFSIEPFVISEGQLTSWADVATEHRLAEGSLPIPSARWQQRDFELEVESFAAGAPAQSALWARYTLTNRKTVPLELALVLAVRPFQVNPPTQFLNVAGGVSAIRTLHWDGAALSVNGVPALFPLAAPDHIGLTRFDAGSFPEAPAPTGGRAAQQLEDPTGLASGTLVYSLQLQAGQSVSVGLVAPLTGARLAPTSSTHGSAAALAELSQQRAQTLATWREKLERVSIRVPPAAQPVVDSLRSALAHILMSRTGPVLRPGTRSYARSWIRDGAMMAEALLRLGHEDVARDYLSWFAPFQFEGGKVPCCVDRRGADPVVENDSAGEFIFLVAELFRFTRDRALLAQMWPHVEAAARYLEALRQSERSPQNLAPGRRAFYGLMPPSISHEGYSDKPAYSYWDDFWALIGYEDAAELADALGLGEAKERLSRQRDEFRRELGASVRSSAALHGVGYVPGSADRGDFDATSTTIALAPGRAGAELPQELLLATFERYFAEFEARRDGRKPWRDYTPYELRVVGSFVRLGQRDRAHALLQFFFGDQRPRGWNQWAEVVGREPREPRFIGDMPHAWIASDYIRSALDLFAYARPAEQQLVLAAGLPPAWFDGPGVSLERLRTPYGALSYAARAQGTSVVFEIRGASPPGGFALPWPWDGAPGHARVNGKEARFQGRELRFASAPARVVLERPGSGP